MDATSHDASPCNMASCGSDILSTIINIISIIFIVIRETFHFMASILIPFYERIPAKDVSNIVILITGGGSGIGALMAKKLAKLGAIIIIWDINDAGMDAVKADIESDNNNGVCHTYHVDITNRKLVAEMAFKIRNEIGRPVNILINNAGIVAGKRMEQLTDEDIIKTMNVNLMSMFWTIRSFLPEMKSCGADCHIVNVASLAGFAGVGSLTDYCASKFGVVGLTESFGQELIADGFFDKIKLTLIAPALIDTGLFKGARAKLLAPLAPDAVADIIVDGMRRNQMVVMIPSNISIVVALKSLLPMDASLKIAQIFGLEHFMSGFTGRK